MSDTTGDAVPLVSDWFERRFKDRLLERAVADFPAHERSALVAQVEDLSRRLDALVEATQKVREALSFDVLLTRLMALITEAFGADRSSLFLYDAETKELFSRVAQGEKIDEIRFPADAGVAGDVFQSGQPAIINNAYADARFNSAIDAVTGYHTHSILCARAAKVFGAANAWVADSIDKVIATRTSEAVVDASLRTFDGRAVAVNLNAAPLQDTEGALLGCTLLLEDITEDKRVRATMARYMTAKVAEQVLAAGEAVLGGRSQNATILFSDIKGFTGIAEVLGPQDTVSMLNEYFTEMVEIVFAHNGILDKYIGDAIMAVFGTPFASAQDADNAVHAAILMQQALAELNRRRARRGMPQFEVRIGINSGDVVAGNIGSARRMDYTVAGDGVTAPARLEGANKYLGTRILISGSTREQLREPFRLREIDLLRVSGKLAPVPVFEVLGATDSNLSAREEAALGRYAEGLAAYRGRDWRAAIAHFDGVVELTPADAPARLLLERARRYVVQPPPADWDGAWSLSEK